MKDNGEGETTEWPRECQLVRGGGLAKESISKEGYSRKNARKKSVTVRDEKEKRRSMGLRTSCEMEEKPASIRIC
jgi:hypothetical protein